MKPNQIIKLKGFSITKEDFESKYHVTLSEIEWGIIRTKTEQDWDSHVQELKSIAFRHMKNAMNDIGYRVKLEGKDITFQKTN